MTNNNFTHMLTGRYSEGFRTCDEVRIVKMDMLTAIVTNGKRDERVLVQHLKPIEKK
jgi:hypothetical protein